MRILYVSHFFPPEKGAAANRAYRITKGLKCLNVQVDVLTTFPSYPDGVLSPSYRFSGTKVEYTREGVKVIRVPIQPVSNREGYILRMINQLSFLIYGLMRWGYLNREYNVVIASSPPLFAGLLGKIVADRTGSKFILDVRDLWPETLESVGGKLSLLASIPLGKLAMYLYKNSDLIISPVRGILHNIQHKYTGDKEFMWVPNGIFVSEDITEFYKTPEHPSLIYAGVIGTMQDNKSILKLADHLPEYDFYIVGDGKERKLFTTTTHRNVHYLGVLPWEKTMKLIGKSAFGIAFYKNVELMRDAIPSKIIEYGALKKPIVMNIDNEGAYWVKLYNAGIVVENGDVKLIAENIRSVWNDKNLYDELARGAQRMVEDVFNMEKITKLFYSKLEEIV